MGSGKEGRADDGMGGVIGVSKRGQVLGLGIIYRVRGRMKNDESGKQEATKVATPRLENFYRQCLEDPPADVH